MCGIFCSIHRSEHIKPSHELQRRLHQRGPDSQQTIYRSQAGFNVTLCSTVLSLRGSKTVTQPLVDESGDYVLCWNGEAWSIDDQAQTGNDTEAVFQVIQNAVETAKRDEIDDTVRNSTDAIAAALSRVAGPYAFVFYDACQGRLFLGRDFLGRRSLVVSTANDGGSLLIASVSDGDDTCTWTELNADGVYCIDLCEAASRKQQNEDLARKLGPLNAVVMPYRFAEEGSSYPILRRSVIPRVSLNKTISNQSLSLNIASTAVEALEVLLKAALSLRVINIPEPPHLREGGGHSLSRAKLAVLFSGGLDCTILARIAHDILPMDEPIDLLNVAFENPRIHNAGASTGSYELCPDRITGRSSYKELCKICPNRVWRFVAIDVPYAESQSHRPTVISLMAPHNTEMDLSISLALYFAARGQGQIPDPTSCDDENKSYTSSARVLLSGLGADELFGGYTRHAAAYRHGGMIALLDELELDVSRLGTRNLGRDDRVMSHWSREVRFPYLDEKVIGWAVAAPVGEKCGFGTTSGDDGDVEPGKKVLRCLAMKLGIEGVAKEKKRAIQFGARTAKMETRKIKGTTLLS